MNFFSGVRNRKVIQQIESAQKDNTNFHSLVIGSSGNNAAIKCFNHLVEQVHEIKMHDSVFVTLQYQLSQMGTYKI